MRRGALLLLFGVTIALAPSVAAAAASLLLPDGIADPSGKSGFVAIESGVVGIDLESGKVAWRSVEAAIPLVAWDGKLAVIARGPDLVVVILDASTGSALARTKPIPLPEWASLSNKEGKSFQASASYEGGTVVLGWAAGWSYWGGVPPRPGQVTSGSARGVARIDADSGDVTTVSTSVPDRSSSDLSHRPATSPPLNTGHPSLEVGDEILVLKTVWPRGAGVLEVIDKATQQPKRTVPLLVGEAVALAFDLNGRSIIGFHGIPAELQKSSERVFTVFSLDGTKLRTLTCTTDESPEALVSNVLLTVRQQRTFYGPGPIPAVVPRELRAYSVPPPSRLTSAFLPFGGALLLWILALLPSGRTRSVQRRTTCRIRIALFFLASFVSMALAWRGLPAEQPRWSLQLAPAIAEPMPA